jgi:hypothetical protein
VDNRASWKIWGMNNLKDLADLIGRHESPDYHAFTWSCDCGVDFHDADSHADHLAAVLNGILGLHLD